MELGLSECQVAGLCE